MEYVRFARLRGKGAPKKKRTAAQGEFLILVEKPPRSAIR